MFFGSLSDFDILTAKALLEIRSILLKHPKRRTALLPYGWTRRYGHVVGSYEAFVKSHVPDVFMFQVSEFTGLFTVELVESFANNGYMAYQKIISKYKIPVESMLTVSEDAQYVAICNIQERDKRAAICGGIEMLDMATARLARLAKQHPMGCTFERGVQYLAEVGILPIPLEWFDSLFVVTGHSLVYLRKRPVNVLTPTSEAFKTKIETFLENSPTHTASVDELNRICQLLPNDVTRILKGCPRVFFEPSMIFPCLFFHNTIVGYYSPDQILEQRLSNEVATMSPFRHLLRSIEAVLEAHPSKRIPSEYILAWCAALDVKPRLAWQCLQCKVFWSGSLSNQQILLRSPAGKSKHPNPVQDAILPRDVVAEIVSEVKRLGNKCTLDKLVANCQWGKGSLYRKTYGSLGVLLPDISDIFYDPAHMYDRRIINEDVVWPEADVVDIEGLILRTEVDWRNLASFSASMVYYLSQSAEGSQTYPLQDCLNSIAQFGFVLNDILRLSHLFVPSDVVYLRRSQGETEIIFPESRIEFAVIHALRQSPLKALDLDRLVKELVNCGRFSLDVIDSLRYSFISVCGDLSTGNAEDISQYCYFNPAIVTLRVYASQYLFVDMTPAKAQSVEEFLPQTKSQVVLDTQEEDVDEPLEIVIPRWCLQNVIVNIEKTSEQWCITGIGSNGVVTLLNMLNQMHDEVSVEAIAPRTLRAGDKVQIIEGPWAGRSGQLVGFAKMEGSVQLSKFEYKSIPLSSLVPVR